MSDKEEAKTIKLDWDALELAFANNSPEMRSFLDRKTGEVVWWAEDYGGDEETEALKERIGTEPARYAELEPPRSREEWQWMEEFTQTVPSPSLRQRLLDAISGKGAFRRFKDTLYDAPGEQKRWYSFREKRLQEALLAWLDANGIKAENPPPWARRGEEARAQPPFYESKEGANERSQGEANTTLFIDLLEEKHERLGFELDELRECKLLLDGRPLPLLLPSSLEEELEVLVASEREGVLFVLARPRSGYTAEQGFGLLLVAKKDEKGRYLPFVWHLLHEGTAEEALRTFIKP